MDANSGKIVLIEDEADARAKGLVPLSEAEAAVLKALPEAQRPAALLKSREVSPLHPLGRLPGLTEDDIRKLRNAAKRDRRARRC